MDKMTRLYKDSVRRLEHCIKRYEQAPMSEELKRFFISKYSVERNKSLEMMEYHADLYRQKKEKQLARRRAN